MTAQQLMCRICEVQPATYVIEGRTLVALADRFEVLSHFEASCSNTFCLEVLAKQTDQDASVHVDTTPLNPALCVDGLIPIWCGDEWEFFACMGCPGCEAA